MDAPFASLPSRSTFIRTIVSGGIAAALGSRVSDEASAAGVPAGPYEDFNGVLTTALIAEQLASTFYYTALTSHDLMSDSQLGGSSTDPNHPGAPPNGNPANVRFLHAALDAEFKHAEALLRSGAKQAFTHFYFPATTFEAVCVLGQLCTLGSSGDPTTFLGVQAVLEEAFVGAYLAAIIDFVRLGHPASAELAANIAGVEAEHLFIGRSIAGETPANNLALQPLPFKTLSAAATALQPFLTGKGFAHGATRAIPFPKAAQIAKVVGTSITREVTSFL